MTTRTTVLTTLATMIRHTITTAIMVNNSITYNAFAKLYLTLYERCQYSTNMKFNYYDTLVNLVLGYLLLFLIIAVEKIEYIESFSIAYIAAGFVLGYFINALSSIVEPIYFWTFGGKPSVKIFRINKNCEYSGIKTVPFYETQKAINYLKNDNDNDNENKWFEIATRTIGNNKDSRVPTFNEHYAFSRVMLTFIIISIAILISRYYSCWQFYVISIPMLAIAWYRCKMRGYYYAREVLKEYINIKENK